MNFQKLPTLQGRLSGGTIEQFQSGYALVKQLSNPSQVSYGGLMPVYLYHIVKLAANGKGWCNGRYDLPDNEETQNKFLSIARY